MHPLSTQIAFTCNQPYNFSLWCQGKPADNLSPHIDNLVEAYGLIESTKSLLLSLEGGGLHIPSRARVDLGPGVYIEFLGNEYVHDFLIPNFYFHLVTSYDILRMIGAPIGKKDYMLHLKDLVKTE